MALDDCARNWTPLGAGPPIPGGQRGLPGAGGWATPSMWVPVRARGSHHAQGKAAAAAAGSSGRCQPASRRGRPPRGAGGSGRWAPERPAAACFAYSGTGVATMAHYGQRRQQTVPQRDEEGNNENTSSPPSGRDAHLQSADAGGAINSGPTRYAPPARKDNVPCLSSERTYCRRPRNGGAPQPRGVAGRGGAGSVGLPTSAPRRDAQCGNARGEMRPRHRHRQCNRPDTATCPLPFLLLPPLKDPALTGGAAGTAPWHQQQPRPCPSAPPPSGAGKPAPARGWPPRRPWRLFLAWPLPPLDAAAGADVVRGVTTTAARRVRPGVDGHYCRGHSRYVGTDHGTNNGRGATAAAGSGGQTTDARRARPAAPGTAHHPGEHPTVGQGGWAHDHCRAWTQRQRMPVAPP